MINYEDFLKDIYNLINLLKNKDLQNAEELEKLLNKNINLENLYNKLISSIPYRIYTANTLKEETLIFVKELKELINQIQDNNDTDILSNHLKTLDSIINADAMEFNCMKALKTPGKTMNIEITQKKYNFNYILSYFLKILINIFREKSIVKTSLSMSNEQCEDSPR